LQILRKVINRQEKWRRLIRIILEVIDLLRKKESKFVTFPNYFRIIPKY